LNIHEILTSINWKPAIGDPTAIGWVITVAYFVAAFFCWKAGLAEKKSVNNGKASNQVLWFGLSALLLVLEINKQLDLQTLVISLGQGIAKENGWYGIRREVQAAFVMLAGLFGFLLLFGLLWRLRKCWRQYWLILSGLLFIIVFVLIRAASFNHVDYLLSRWRVIGPVKMKYVAELGGIMLEGAGDYYSRFKGEGNYNSGSKI
jgi:hypothetical protein